MQHSLAQQREACPTISLSFDQFQFRDVSLDHPVIDPPGEASSHGVFIFLDPRGKGLEFGKVTVFYLGQPGIKVLSRAAAQHLRKLLNQVIGQIDFWVDLTEFDERFLLPLLKQVRLAI